MVIPSLNAGGMERVMSELANYFAKMEIVDLHLVLYGKKPEIFYPLPKNISIHKPVSIFIENRRLWSTLNRFYFLRKVIKKIQPDSILSFGEYWNSFVLIALYRLKFPVYISDRCQPDKDFGKLHTFFRKWLYPKAAGIIAQTNIAQDIFQKQKLNENIQVIGNPIRKIEVGKASIKKENIILTVGRLISTKHHDNLIKIFARINNPEWKLVIVGDDAIKQKNKISLQKLIEELNLEGQVVLAGSRNDVDSFYQKSKIFAFTSSSEGFPNVLGEAMSAGLPVVAYDCMAGPSEMISNGENGFLIPLFDDELFTDKLQELVNNEHLRKEITVKAKVSIAKFSPDKVGNQFLQFILAVL